MNVQKKKEVDHLEVSINDVSLLICSTQISTCSKKERIKKESSTTVCNESVNSRFLYGNVEDDRDVDDYV